MLLKFTAEAHAEAQRGKNNWRVLTYANWILPDCHLVPFTLLPATGYNTGVKRGNRKRPAGRLSQANAIRDGIVGKHVHGKFSHLGNGVLPHAMRLNERMGLGLDIFPGIRFLSGEAFREFAHL